MIVKQNCPAGNGFGGLAEGLVLVGSDGAVGCGDCRAHSLLHSTLMHLHSVIGMILIIISETISIM